MFSDCRFVLNSQLSCYKVNFEFFVCQGNALMWHGTHLIDVNC